MSVPPALCSAKLRDGSQCRSVATQEDSALTMRGSPMSWVVIGPSMAIKESDETLASEIG